MSGPFSPSLILSGGKMNHRVSIRLRPEAYAETGRVFSVTIGTSPRAPVFADLDFGAECVEVLRHQAVSRGNAVFAYCLMPDHVHLLVGTVEASPLTAFVQAWKSLCYRARRRRGHAAVFWQRGFWDHALRSEEGVREAALYILANPIRKGIVQHFREYPLCGSFEYDLGDT